MTTTTRIGNTRNGRNVSRREGTNMARTTTRAKGAKSNNTSKGAKASATTKECPRCKALGRKAIHPVDEFYKDRSTKDGRAVWCKACEREYNVAYNARRALKDATTAVEEFKATAKKGARVPKNLADALKAARVKVDNAVNHDPVGRGAKTPTHVA